MGREATRRSKPAQRGIQSIERGLHLLEIMTGRSTAMPLSELAAAARMPASVAHRYMVSFVRHGFVEQTAEGTYDLGSAVLVAGLAKLARLDSFRIGLSHLDELRRATGETALLVAWNGQGPVVIRWIEAERQVNVYVRPGSVLPMLSSASGRVFAAFLPSAQAQPAIDREFASGVVPTLDGHRLTRTKFHDLLGRIRGDGIACLKGDFTPGIDAVCAPVFDHQHRIQFALTVLGPAGAADLGPRSGSAAAVRRIAAACSRALGDVSSIS